MSEPSFLAVSIGNTRTQLGRFVGAALQGERRISNSDVRKVIEAAIEDCASIEQSGRSTVVIASVNEPLARQVDSGLRDVRRTDIYRVGEDLPIPIGMQLDPETITGVDRLLNAAAAYATLRQACVVVDAGTAVTVDFVDGKGTFHGGAIAAGARMQLRALHAGTALLPDMEFRAPAREPFGRSTAEAMLQGVYFGLRGLVWKLVEQYAEAYGAFPHVIATGGDAALLFEGDELIDRIVPDLTLLGIAESVRQALGVGSDGPFRGDEP